jgi:uncharacterized Ntn-hydrolase superfamily protein
MRLRALGKALLLAVLCVSAGFGQSRHLSTWSIVAVDPKTGDVGVAGATCLPGQHADAIAALVPGKGAAAVQAFWDLANRDNAYQLLRQGESAEGIVRRLTDRNYDTSVDDRQYGVVTISNGAVKVAAFTGKEDMAWAGSQQDPENGVTVQGNILASPEVVRNALAAFKRGGAMSDRLMNGLEAGSAAGGDIRCNNAKVRQTAASAFIIFAHGGDPPYAALDIGSTDDGTGKGPWLDISVVEPEFGPNPVTELRRRYDLWKRNRR